MRDETGRPPAATTGDIDLTGRYYEDPAVVASYTRRRTGEPLNGLLHQRQVRFVNQVMRQRAPRRVLEMAPGPARLTAELDYRGPLVAIDRSAEMLAEARAQFAQLPPAWTLARGDAFALPVGSAAVDFVLTTRFIRRFQLDDRRRLYAEVRRVLRPGGALLLDAQNRTVCLPHREARGLDRYPVFDQLYLLPELVAELDAAGFRVARVQGMLRHSRLQRQLNRLRHVGLASVSRVLLAAIEAVPGREPSTWMVVCEPRA